MSLDVRGAPVVGVGATPSVSWIHVPAVRSGLLAAWASAWLAGSVSLDEAVDAVSGDDARHTASGLPGSHPDRAGALADVMVAWRRHGAGVRLVLPVAGDVRGLPGPAAFRDAALEAGEAVVGGPLGAVPSVVGFGPSSAPTSVVWQVFAIEPAPPDFVDLTDAQFELVTAIRETATALTAADVAGSADQQALAEARRAGEQLELPRGFPQRAVALLAQAERMQAVLDLALADPVGGAVDRFGIAARTSALRPLITTVRRARLAGYNAAAETSS